MSTTSYEETERADLGCEIEYPSEMNDNQLKAFIRDEIKTSTETLSGAFTEGIRGIGERLNPLEQGMRSLPFAAMVSGVIDFLQTSVGRFVKSHPRPRWCRRTLPRYLRGPAGRGQLHRSKD